MQKYRSPLQTRTTSVVFVNPEMTSEFTFDPGGGHFLHLFEGFKLLQFPALDTGGQQYRSRRSSWFPVSWKPVLWPSRASFEPQLVHGHLRNPSSICVLPVVILCTASSSLQDSSSLICLRLKSCICIEKDVEKLTEGRRPSRRPFEDPWKTRHLTLSSMLNYFSHKQWPHCRGWGRLHGNRACQPPPGGV